MLRLFTFGGLGLESDPGQSAKLRRPHLAMLAVLAAAGERGMSRERIARLLWPESDEEHARHSARQVLYALRQELGPQVVRTMGSNLGLDPGAITTDVAEFRAALATGDRRRAVALARGPFLDGFYLSGAPEFGRWIEEERSRLTSAMTSALLSLATEASVANDRDAAVEWWRKLTALEPLNGRFAVGYLKALAARGDRAKALAFARQHEMVMRRELETDPDPEVRKLEAELRATSSPEFTVSGSAAAARLPTAAVADHTAVAGVKADATTVPNGDRVKRRWPLQLSLAAVGTALYVVATTAIVSHQQGLAAANGTPTFAVGVIREEGVPDSQRLGPVLTDMVSTNLARVEGLKVLSNSRLLELMQPAVGDSVAGYAEAARRAGATELLEGQLLAAPGGVTLEIRRVELRTGIVNEVYRVRAADRYAVVDSMTRVVATAMRLSPVGPVADATTNSLSAYRLYEEGLRAFHHGDMPTARRLMRAALVEDSLFAMAAFFEAQLTGTFGKTLDGRSGLEANRTALRLAQRAPERERLTITTNILMNDGDPKAVAVAESLATRYPHDPRVLMTLAKVRATSGNWAGAVEASERAIALDSLAEASGSAASAGLAGSPTCNLCDDLWTLTYAYVWWDSMPAALRVARRFQSLRPNMSPPYHLLAINTARIGDSVAANAWNRRRVALNGIDQALQVRLNLMLEAYDVVEQEVRPLLASTSTNERDEGFWSYFIALRNQGRLREASILARDGWFTGLPPLSVKHEPSGILEAVAALDNGEAHKAAQIFRTAPIVGPTFPPGVRARDVSWRAARVGMALAASGDEAAVRALADSVETWGRLSLYGRDQKLHHYLRGLLHAAVGRHEDAVREFSAAMFSPSLGFTRVNYEMARSLLAIDRPRDAVAVLQASLRGDPDASNLYVSRTVLHELLAEAFDRAGERDSAAVHYRAVLKAWRRADPLFHERRERVAAWLATYGAAFANTTARR